MSVLSEIVRNVVALVLIFSCLELFLPAGELSRFVRLTCGIILLALIVVPAAEAWQNLAWKTPLSAENSLATADYEEITSQIDLVLDEEIARKYEADASRQIIAIASLAEGVVDVTTTLEINEENGAIQRANIIAIKKPGLDSSQVEQRIKALLINYFGFTDEIMDIQIQEDG